LADALATRRVWNEFTRAALHRNIAKKKTQEGPMTSGDNYLFRAAEFFAKAESETDLEMRAGFENLARAYLRLAEQALRNAQTDVIYEPAPPKLHDPELKR
jgi:hypothetical protein